MNITFKLNKDYINHECLVERKGDWLIFTCPDCQSFERKWNIVTSEMTHTPGEDPTILHNGTFVPVGLESFEASPN